VPDLNGAQHAATIAMYLSKDTARTPELRAGKGAFIRAGGSLGLLLPILRAWRIAYAQRSARATRTLGLGLKRVASPSHSRSDSEKRNSKRRTYLFTVAAAIIASS
jgi:hypothetical protein